MEKRISDKKETALNKIVYRYNMTQRSKVGTVTKLILKENFQSKEDWEDFYYSLGEERRKKIEEKKKEDPTKTELKRFKRKTKRKYGRTEDELEDIGEELYSKIPEQIERLREQIETLKEEVSEEDCKECIKQYVIDNTWEGVMEREKNVVERLEKEGISNIEKTTGKDDAEYGVDREIVLENGKKIGLQIKPRKAKVKPLVLKQNRQAQAKYPGRVFLILAKKEGQIEDKEEKVKKIKKEIERLSQS